MDQWFKNGANFSLKAYCNHVNRCYLVILLPRHFSFLISYKFLYYCSMKKIILFLITIITFTNVNYASFPVVEKVSDQTTGSMTDPLFPTIFYILGIVAFILFCFTILNFLKNGFSRRQWWIYLSSSILFIYFAFWFVAPLLWMALYFLIVEPNF